jgi:hypothetical protein
MWKKSINIMFSSKKRKKRLGPGGLDPVQVIKSLPMVKNY